MSTARFARSLNGIEPLGLAVGGVLVAMLGAPAVFAAMALGLALCALPAWFIRSADIG